MMQALRFSTMTIGNFFVLFGDARLRVQNQDRDVAARDGILRALDAEKFNGIVHAPRLADAGRVNQHIFFAARRRVSTSNGTSIAVARRAGNRR